MTTALSPAIPAATLVIFRDHHAAASATPPEILMVERARAMAFAAGALVFPGGRIDPGDRQLAAGTPLDPDDAAARIAAIRETIEETGIGIGLVPMPGHAELAALRAALHDGVAFADALAAADVALDLDALVPFARWRPAHHETRVFDTRFYLARLPADAPPATVDATENVRLAWASADAVLADAAAGRARLIFPTQRNLERLAQFPSFAAAVADADAHPVRRITPWVEQRDGVDHICIPTDAGYPVTAVPLAGMTRG